MVDTACSTNVLLETIMEETSDDLRSETSESDYNSGLLTDSVSTVIHVPSYELNHKGGRNSYYNDRKCSTEINTDPGVQDDDDDEDDFTDEEEDDEEEEENTNDSEDGESDERADPNGFPSRTNSLLQFENLEKHYESIFQTQRSIVDPYDLSGVYENRRSTRSWRFKSSSQPENLNHFHDIDNDNNDSSSLSSTCSSSSSSLLSSDEVLSSSYSSKYDSLSRRLSLRSFRSIDSLTSLHQKHEKEHELLHSAELSQSLNENISKIDSQPADEIAVPARGLYKTMECLSEIPSVYCNEVAAAAAAVVAATKKEESNDSEHLMHQQPPKTRRSTENLSEDSGFGDHITREASAKNLCGTEYTDERGRADELVATNAAEVEPVRRDEVAESSCHMRRREGRTGPPLPPPLPPPPPPPPSQFATQGGENVDAIFSGCSGGGGSSCWQSDPNLLNATFVIRDGVRSDVASCDETDAADVADECHDVNAEDSTMASRMTVASTPNLYHDGADDDREFHYRGSEVRCGGGDDCNDSTVSLSRVYSLKRINFTSESELSAGPASRGSNVQIMTSFVSVASGANQANGKGVHFCPVVAEVNWRESYSSDSDDDDDAVEEEEELLLPLEGPDYGSDYEQSPSPIFRERFSSRSAPAVNTLLEEEEAEEEEQQQREFSPPLDVLVKKLLSDSVTASKRNERELQRAQQRARLDLITSPPPTRGGVAGSIGNNNNNNNNSSSSSNNNNNKSSSSLNESTSSSSWSSPTRTNFISYHSAAFDGAMNSSGGGGGGGGASEVRAESATDKAKVAAVSPTKSSPVGKLGGFFQRFSLKRLSGRKSKKKAAAAAATAAPPVVVGVVPKGGGGAGGNVTTSAAEPNSRIIPLTGDYEEVSGGRVDHPDDRNYEADGRTGVVSSKPPLPPAPPVAAGTTARRRPSGEGGGGGSGGGGGGASTQSPNVSARQQPEQHQRRQYSHEYGVDSHTPIMLRKTAATAACIDRRSPPPSSSSSSSSPPRRTTAGFGLLETDIDSNVTLSTSNVSSNSANAGASSGPHNGHGNVGSSPANSKKSRSLLNLDNGRLSLLSTTPSSTKTSLGGGATDSMKAAGGSPHHGCNDYRAKSMEFLLDKENQAAVKAPENELQKGNGERKMSEHELRVQRSLQKLNVPEWYKNSAVPSQGFLLKRHSDAGQNVSQNQRWNTNTLPSKTTSLSSLGPNLSIAPRSPTSSSVTSPGHTHYSFSRWSTSRLNSGTNSSNTSPSGSARSSFNYRQPYLGWRSQEKLSKPRTPAERLAAGILPQRSQNGSQQSSPSLTEVRSSIKEVTSAIVHYVSGTRDSSDRLSPSLRYYGDSSSRSTSPRGSTGRLCWLESSFVGSKPSNVPETPSAVPENKIPSSQHDRAVTVAAATAATEDPYSNYSATNNNSQQKYCGNQAYNNRINGSESTIINNFDEYSVIASRTKQPTKQINSDTTTLDDILDSLLGLSSSSRTPSPAKSSLESEMVGPTVGLGDHPRRSYGDNVTNTNDSIFICITDVVNIHRCSCCIAGNECPCKKSANSGESSKGLISHASQLNVRLVVQCKYPKCGKFAEPAEAKRTFKVCHNCDYIYCSRECRQDHWEKHRKACLQSRISDLCHRLLNTIKSGPDLLLVTSRVARRGFLEHGRGCVKYYFHSPQIGEQFVAGHTGYPEPMYVKWSLLEPNEMGNELHSALVRVCKSYNPDTRLVILVAVHVVSEVPSTGSVKWERQIIFRYSKTKLSCDLVSRDLSPYAANKAIEYPATLILTSLPGVERTQKEREVNFTNIQRQLRQRGVSLRKQFPEVYKNLCDYVEGANFTPTTIYPLDAASGKTFMCVIMPDAEPQKLDLLPKENDKVQTVDISQSASNSSEK